MLSKAELVSSIRKAIAERQLKEMSLEAFIRLFRERMLTGLCQCRCPKCDGLILFGGTDRKEPYLYCMKPCGWGVFAYGDLKKADLEKAFGGGEN